MSHLLVAAVSIAGLLLLTKFAYDWLEYRNRKRQAVDIMSRLRSMNVSGPLPENEPQQNVDCEMPPKTNS